MSRKPNTANNSAEMAKIIVAAMEDKKAEDIQVLDISTVSVLADYFIIGSGKSRTQMTALMDNVEEQMEKAGYTVRHVEGFQSDHWILMDYGDVVLHIFDEETRGFFNMERLWRDARPVSVSQL